MSDYEHALLGAILTGYRDLPTIARIISAADFENIRDGQIFDACLAVHAAGERPSRLTVKHQLGSAALKLPGGPVYLVDLTCQVPDQAPFLASKVREASIRRQIGGLGARCRQIETDLDTSTDDLLAKIKTWAEQIGSSTLSPISSVAAALEQVIDTAEHGEAAATPTPWLELNKIIDGWYPGQLITVGARPSVGKSLFLENAATDVARMFKRRVLFVSLEMTAKELTQRTMANTSKVPLSAIRKGGKAISEADWARINHASGLIEQTPMELVDRSNQTLADIRGSAWEVKQAATRAGEQFGLVVVDYTQLITARTTRDMTRQQQIGEITRGLKQLAKELGVPVLTAAQLSRAGQQRPNPTPVLADLREAGDIEQDSDVVIFLHEVLVEINGRSQPTGEVEVIVAKNRNGPLGQLSLSKHGAYARLA